MSAMFTVDEPTAAAIRKAYVESGEFAGCVCARSPAGSRCRPCPCEEAPGLSDPIITAVMAHSIQTDAAQAHVLFA